MKKVVILFGVLLAAAALPIFVGGGNAAQGPASKSAAADMSSGSHAAQPDDMFQGSVIHKGRVVTTMNSGGYTYVEIEENGKKLWAAVMETRVKVGDLAEFPDSPPMENFHSKTLNRTFPAIIFSPAIKINGTLQVVPTGGAGSAGTDPHAGMKSRGQK
jgi:hypothetical protein